MYKSEIERRLNKFDYRRLPQLMEITTSFEDITNEEDYKRMLQVADISGIKYVSFFKLKENANINDFRNQIVQINYNPNLPYIEEQSELSSAKITIKENQSFEILSNFYHISQIWKKSNDGRNQTLIDIQERKVLHLDFYNNTNILYVSIDPIGTGSSVAEKMKLELEQLFLSYSLDFNNYFEIKCLENTIYDKIDAQELRPTKISNQDETRNIEFNSEAKNPSDSLVDQDCFIKMKNRELDIKRMKLKNDSKKLTLELFSNDTIRIWNKATWEQIDEFKNSIIRVL